MTAAEHLTQSISALGHLLELRIDQALSDEGITARQFIALVHIASDPNLHRSSLSRILHISPQVAAGLTHRLRDRGLLQRTVLDRWSPITFAITDIGLRCLARTRPIVTQVERDTLSHLSGRIASTLVEAVSALVHEVDWLAGRTVPDGQRLHLAGIQTQQREEDPCAS